MRCRFIEMTGRASRTDMEDIFADERKEEVAGRGGQKKLPPTEHLKTFRPYREDGDASAQERSGLGEVQLFRQRNGPGPGVRMWLANPPR